MMDRTVGQPEKYARLLSRETHTQINEDWGDILW